MKATTTLLLLITFLQTIAAQGFADNRQQYAAIGNFTLQSGQVIYNCNIGYRAYGHLNAAHSNAIIFPSYFTGTAKDVEDMVTGYLFDTAAYYVILIDALGDGVSSSPSNSVKQPGLQFPVFTIADMVESQYTMLTQQLHIQHVVAVAGISMGGMQAFQWVVSHPGFMDKAIPIVGSPQMGSPDLALWNIELEAINRDTAYHNGHYTGHPALATVAMVHRLAVVTPQNMNEKVLAGHYKRWQQEAITGAGFDWNNWVRQLQAMISMDVATIPGGPLDDAAKKVTAKMLVIPSVQDHMVNPATAITFANLVHAKLLLLEGNCGHIAVACEMDKVIPAVRAFMKGE